MKNIRFNEDTRRNLFTSIRDVLFMLIYFYICIKAHDLIPEYLIVGCFLEFDIIRTQDKDNSVSVKDTIRPLS